MSLWLIRAGKLGERESFALEKNCAIIGWEALPDLSNIKQRSQLKDLLCQNYPEEKPNTLRNWESQLWPFIQTIKVGDLVALPLKTRSIIAVGRVTGDYQYRRIAEGHFHTRPVEWLKEFTRTQFDEDLRFSLGAFMTVCEISRNKAEERVKIMLSGKQRDITSSNEPMEASENEARKDYESLSQDDIRLHITKKFKGHKLAELIGGIFKAKGFEIRISPPGPDGGIDIIAGGGILGFGDPKLAIQVKSQDNPVDAKELREFRTSMKDSGAQHGLFVAWGGYNKAAAKEARNLFFDLRLWTADDIISAIQENYDKLSDDLQAELRLKRIWTLVKDEDLEN